MTDGFKTIYHVSRTIGQYHFRLQPLHLCGRRDRVYWTHCDFNYREGVSPPTVAPFFPSPWICLDQVAKGCGPSKLCSTTLLLILTCLSMVLYPLQPLRCPVDGRWYPCISYKHRFQTISTPCSVGPRNSKLMLKALSSYRPMTHPSPGGLCLV
jgi:hypothetical protein